MYDLKSCSLMVRKSLLYAIFFDVFVLVVFEE